MMQRVHIIISGDVQGVGYRAWALRQARDFRLTGWVKNREDDAVEIVAEGPGGDLGEFVKACQHGPEVAWVKHTDVTWETATREFAGFEVLY